MSTHDDEASIPPAYGLVQFAPPGTPFPTDARALGPADGWRYAGDLDAGTLITPSVGVPVTPDGPRPIVTNLGEVTMRWSASAMRSKTTRTFMTARQYRQRKRAQARARDAAHKEARRARSACSVPLDIRGEVDVPIMPFPRRNADPRRRPVQLGTSRGRFVVSRPSGGRIETRPPRDDC